MALAGKVCVVSGASGIVGGGIARRMLLDGATVVAPVRSERSKAKALDILGGISDKNLHTPLLDIHSLPDALALADYIQFPTLSGYIKDNLGSTVDHVISISGGMAPAGTLTEATPEAVDITVHDKLLGHLWLAKALVPLLREVPATSYTIATGFIGETCPWPEAALTAVGNGAAYALAVALQAELRGKPQRVNELRIGVMIRRDEEAFNPSAPAAPSAPVSKLAEFVVTKVVGDERVGDSVVRVTEGDLA